MLAKGRTFVKRTAPSQNEQVSRYDCDTYHTEGCIVTHSDQIHACVCPTDIAIINQSSFIFKVTEEFMKCNQVKTLIKKTESRAKPIPSIHKIK